MLVLSRHETETVSIPFDENTARALLEDILQNGTRTIVISVQAIQRHPYEDKVKLGFESPQCLPIVRSELLDSLDGIVHQSVTQCIHNIKMSDQCDLCHRFGFNPSPSAIKRESPKLPDESAYSKIAR